ncbi:HisA/HisF-related TIM barrel protein [Streptomyces sp. NBC_01275]|uniref:HisA/HisF-related TIM barrel protein n=1 Tax=Streptomyces sp. NBC_01275 TaxID=2903807 RepID=UPI00224FE3C4|nr:HisA/HisF-related TIM barrel protein [Streptomyces sp. NBC_01275]MCX4763634.1 HisA/HisF-related TIM barrel protein [Streptomyces sp. NBC_01275]
MIGLLPDDRPTGLWRVNVDIRRGDVTARPGEPSDDLLGLLLEQGVPLALIDLDRSIDAVPETTLLERAARRYPGRLWLGGRLTASDPLARRLLDEGAQGLLMGSSGLFREGRVNRTELEALARFPAPERLMVSIDAIDDRVAINGFTTPTTLSVAHALDAVLQATGGRCPVLYTDTAAALRRRPPTWRHVEAIAASNPGCQFWYAGGLTQWAELRQAWSLGLGAVVGRAYLTPPLGLP